MKRVWNALRYGDAETRKCIGSVIFFSVLAVILIIISGVTGKFGLFILGMIAVIAAILYSQTFTLVDDDFVAEVDRKGTKEAVRSVSVKKNGSVSGKKETKKDSEKEDSIEEQEEDRKEERKEEENPDIFRHYDKQTMKRIKRKYHVKKDHRPIIIDSSKSYRIKECPAFIWRVHNKVFLLLLEKEPRRISISRDLIRNMGYKPGVRVNRLEEYKAFEKENLVTSVFEQYLPDYYDSKVKNDPLKSKNLYTIYPDICITNRSAYQVMDLLLLNFMPEDKITKSEKLNGFFKRVYAANILYKDRVYSITEYKDAVEKELSEMCYADIPEREFAITLENLVKGRLISQEYAAYYTDLNDKLS